MTVQHKQLLTVKHENIDPKKATLYIQRTLSEPFARSGH